MSIYPRMKGVADRLLDRYSQGTIILSRTTPGPEPENIWDPVVPVEHIERLNGVVRGVDTRLVGTELGGSVILASDRVATCAVPKMDYKAGDTLSVDGKPVHIIAVEKSPAAGVAAAVKFIIRG